MPALQERKAGATDLRLIGLTKSYGPVPAVRGIDLDVPAGTMVSLIGPSGCGKTTTLRMIAGLERPDDGQIIAGTRTLTDGRHGEPPESRDMGMVFQSYALWPHMTVARNVAYGLKQRKVPGPEIATKVNAVLALVGMGEYGERYPAQLSGGQQQRVALARAIATEPSILLFDEPLSNLDAMLREQMRFEIRSLQQRLGITAVYVTHSQDEALVLSDRIAVMRDGVIAQIGAPLDIFNTPKTEFVATFIGLANILTLAELRNERGRLRGRLANGVEIAAAGTDMPRRRTKISIRPADIAIVADSHPGADVNEVTGRVDTVSFTGGLVDYFVVLDGPGDVRLRVQSTPPMAAQAGAVVRLRFSAARAVVLDDEHMGRGQE
jgi:ABC-type Fe3+/spermidine/putrescine transport system ATPase subunit